MTGMAGHDPGISGHVRPESLVTLFRNTQGVAEPAKGASEVATKSGNSRLEKRTTLLTNTAPEQRHAGQDKEILEKRKEIYEAAKCGKPG